AFQSMMSDIISKKINCVIVKDLSRFGRNYIDMSKYIQVMFPTLNTRFISLNDNYDSEINDEPIDTLLIGLSGLMNEEYLKDCSIKSKMSYNLRATRGLFTSPVAPYGYKRDKNDIHKLVIDDEVKDVVKLIYDLYIEHKSFMAVTKILSERGITTPSEYKQQQIDGYYTNRLTNKKNVWSSDTVATILKNEVYIGNMVQHKREIINYKTKECKKLPKSEWITIKNTHQPIIDKDTFYLVQSLIADKSRTYFKRNSKQPDNYFSGLLYCGDCNSKMTYVNDKNRKYTFYKCKLKSMSTNLCNSEIVKTKELAQVVLKLIQQFIKIACNIDMIVKELEKKEKQVSNKKAFTSKTDIEVQKELLYQQYRNLEISLADYKRLKEDLENKSKIIVYQETTPASEQIKDNKFVQTFAKYKNIRKLNNIIVKDLIQKIIVHNQTNIEITFNFQDEYKEACNLITNVES
ncbi:MAG: recombinase family protein, partial [Christensenellales bacterium]